MSIDLKLLIESEFEVFKDPVEKRGPRHRSQKIGLNLNRKHQNVIAVSQKADPNAVGPLERLRGMKHGRGFVTFQVGMDLKKKYGLDTDDGYLGTTGIRLMRTDKGYDLIKEAVITVDNENIKINNPDDVFEYVPGSHTTFAVYKNVVFYGPETHYDIASFALRGKTEFLQTFPQASKELFGQLVKDYSQFKSKWNAEHPKDDDWYGEGNPRAFFEVSGRASEPEFNVVAFWNPIASINANAKLLQAFFKHIGLIFSPTIVASDNPNTKLGQANVVQKIDRQAMEKQHLVPALKKLNTAAQYNKSGELADKAGFKSSAELNAMKTIGDSVVVETPEVILGKYPREDYISYLFLGTIDGQGALFVPEKILRSHSEIVRALGQKKVDGITFLGNAGLDRKQYTHHKAGVILPKQNGIEATYISCWSEKCKEILPFIEAYMKQIGAQAPFFIEVSNIDQPVVSSGTLEEYTPRG